MAAVLRGLARYQAMPAAAARTPAVAVAMSGGVMLRDHGVGKGRPVLVIPSLINPPTVLDLAPGRSLLEHLAASGLRPLLVDWGETPEPLGLAALVADRLLPLLDALGEPVPVLGYCLGGTLAAALAACRPERVERLALLAAPWHFSGYGAEKRARLAGWWDGVAPAAEALGGVPMELLQPAFWSLDEAGLVAKYARLADAPDAVLETFATLEDWANAGPPLALEATRELAALFADDASGRGLWAVAGRAVSAGGMLCPVLDVVASADRIVPAEASFSAGCETFARLEIAGGHVGMVVGQRAPARLWEPLGDFLAG